MASLFKLPLRLFGLKNLPAVPVDVVGTAETLVRLDLRAKEIEQALQGLTQEYTIGGRTARAYSFLFGGRAADEEARQARGRLRSALAGDPAAVAAALGREILSREGRLADPAVRSDAGDDDLTGLFLDDPTQWTLAWTSFPDVYSRFLPERDAMAAAVDPSRPDAASEAFWPTIAEDGLAFNLLLPKKLTADGLATLRTALGDAVDATVEAAVEAGLAYVVDLTIYEALEPQQASGFVRFTPSTLTLLLQDAESKELTPVAVRVAGHRGAGARVFTRGVGPAPATDSAWVYALLAARTSVTVFGIWFGHVYHWHLVTAAMQYTMFETLAVRHPVRVLLGPQSSYLIPFDDVLLLLFRAIAPPTSIGDGVQFLELSDLYAEGRSFFDDDPTATLAALGVREEDFTFEKPWDRFPIAGRLLAVWEQTESYVATFVDRHWASDEAVQGDRGLQSWIAESGRADGGNVRGLPPMDSRANLQRVLHSLVFRVTVHGSGRIFRVAHPGLSFVANFPPCLQDATIPEPSVTLDTKALLRFLPNTGTIGEMVKFLFTFSFSVPYVPFVPLEGATENLYLDDPASNDALVELRTFLIRFIEELEPETPQLHQWPLNIET